MTDAKALPNLAKDFIFAGYLDGNIYIYKISSHEWTVISSDLSIDFRSRHHIRKNPRFSRGETMFETRAIMPRLRISVSREGETRDLTLCSCRLYPWNQKLGLKSYTWWHFFQFCIIVVFSVTDSDMSVEEISTLGAITKEENEVIIGEIPFDIVILFLLSLCFLVFYQFKCLNVSLFLFVNRHQMYFWLNCNTF